MCFPLFSHLSKRLDAELMSTPPGFWCPMKISWRWPWTRRHFVALDPVGRSLDDVRKPNHKKHQAHSLRSLSVVFFPRMRSEGFPLYTLGVWGWRCVRCTPHTQLDTLHLTLHTLDLTFHSLHFIHYTHSTHFILYTPHFTDDYWLRLINVIMLFVILYVLCIRVRWFLLFFWWNDACDVQAPGFF